MVAYDGINRLNSIFEVTVPYFNNPNLNPLTKLTLPDGTTQGVLLFRVGFEGAAVINNIK
jgi:filamentous hemagglutinin